MAGCVLALSAGTSVTPELGDRPVVIALVNVNVLPMDREHILLGQTVLVREGEIVAIGPSASVVVPRGAVRVEGRGKYLMPGFVDSHVHFRSAPVDNGLGDTVSAHRAGITARINRDLATLYVTSGVTSIISLCGSPLVVQLREQIAQGAVLGPSVVTSGPCIDDSSMTFAEGEALVQHDKAQGYQFLKVYTRLSRQGFLGVAAEARQMDMPMLGHIPRRVGLALMLNEGAVDIAHAEEFLYVAPFHLTYSDAPNLPQTLEPDDIPGVVALVKQSGAYVTATLMAYKTILDQAIDLEEVMGRPCARRVPPEARFGWDRPHSDYVRRLSGPSQIARLRAGLAFQQRLLTAFERGGVPILAGTDALGVPGVGPGCSLQGELDLLVAGGLTPYQALRAATATPGEFLTREFHFPAGGTVAVGNHADLVLLEANPLTDIRNASTLAGVVLNGRWMAADSLRRVAATIVASYGEAQRTSM
jgi:imidazolonepropionase-like amidohydrolase